MDHKPLHKLKLNLNEYSDDKKKHFEFVDCPSCGTHVNSDGINLSNLMAKCGKCSAIFTIDDIKAGLHEKAKAEQPIVRPDGIEKYYYGDELDLTVNQTNFKLEWILSFLAPLYGFGFFAGWVAGEVPLFIPIICGVIALISIASVVTRKRQLSHIRVSGEHLDVVHRPKKFKKNVEIPSSQIEQIYVKDAGNTKTGVFQVMAIVKDGDSQKHEVIIKGLKSIRLAKYIEQEIENHLAINNQKVLEEVK